MSIRTNFDKLKADLTDPAKNAAEEIADKKFLATIVMITTAALSLFSLWKSSKHPTIGPAAALTSGAAAWAGLESAIILNNLEAAATPGYKFSTPQAFSQDAVKSTLAARFLFQGKITRWLNEKAD